VGRGGRRVRGGGGTHNTHTHTHTHTHTNTHTQHTPHTPNIHTTHTYLMSLASSTAPNCPKTPIRSVSSHTEAKSPTKSAICLYRIYAPRCTPILNTDYIPIIYLYTEYYTGYIGYRNSVRINRVFAQSPPGTVFAQTMSL
jgi:hypothetical protein